MIGAFVQLLKVNMIQTQESWKEHRKSLSEIRSMASLIGWQTTWPDCIPSDWLSGALHFIQLARENLLVFVVHRTGIKSQLLWHRCWGCRLQRLLPPRSDISMVWDTDSPVHGTNRIKEPRWSRSSPSRRTHVLPKSNSKKVDFTSALMLRVGERFFRSLDPESCLSTVRSTWGFCWVLKTRHLYIMRSWDNLITPDFSKFFSIKRSDTSLILSFWNNYYQCSVSPWARATLSVWRSSPPQDLSCLVMTPVSWPMSLHLLIFSTISIQTRTLISSEP